MSRRTTASALVLAGLLTLTAGSAQATPGDLDASFNFDGKVTTAIGSGYDIARALALQPDGKIVAAGYSHNGSNDDFALVRYNAAGSLDTGFGPGMTGKVTTPIGSDTDDAYALVLQPDDKLVAAGTSYDGANYEFGLARYKADGTLDPDFGTGGTVTTAIGSDDTAYALVLQPDGKIVAAGSSDGHFALARYNENGTLDTSFNGTGKVTTPIGLSDIAYALALQPDGKLVVAGYRYSLATDDDFALVRYNADGSLDTDFGTGGIVTTEFGSGSDKAYALALQPDGKLVAAGYSSVTFALARYNADGSLDTSFNGTGKVTTAIGSNDTAYALVLQPDGKLVVAGDSSDGANLEFALGRYKADGTLDTGFGSGGTVTTPIVSDDSAYALALQPDGKLVAAGRSYTGTYDFALARYLGSTLTVTKVGTGMGTVSSSPSGIACGSTCSAPFAAVPVTLSAAAAAGSSFAGWSGDCSGTGTCDLTMSADHLATATFVADKTLTVTKVGSGSGSVSSSAAGIDCGSTCSYGFAHGASVTLTATPSPGSSFGGWSGDCSGTDPCLLTMSADHLAMATFVADKTLTVTKAGSGASTVSSSPSGIDCGATCSHAYTHGTSVTLTVTPAAGSIFVGWSGDCSGTDTCTLSMTADHAATVILESDKTLTVAKAGSGSGSGSITSVPAGIDCGSTCAHAYTHGASVTLTATPAAGSTFTGWAGDCSGTGTCTLSMTAGHSVTAIFESDKTLMVAKAGSGSGTVTSSPSGITCGSTCSHAFVHGTSVTLAASASSSSKFMAWSGDCSGTGSCTLAMSADHSATARFLPKCIVPKVKGKTLRAAKKATRKAHCSVGRVEKAFSATVQEGRVISQKPAWGRKLAPGARVNLTVSKGPK